MIDRLKALFRGFDEGGDARRAEGEDHQIAAAALLVEAAHLDSDFSAFERSKILDLLIDRFSLSADDAEALLSAAEDKVDATSHLQRWTQTLKRALDHEERIEVLEMLWEVVYADGELHDYEANLIRRVTGLLHVSDRDSGAARKRALARLDRRRPPTAAP